MTTTQRVETTKALIVIAGQAPVGSALRKTITDMAARVLANTYTTGDLYCIKALLAGVNA